MIALAASAGKGLRARDAILIEKAYRTAAWPRAGGKTMWRDAFTPREG